MAKRSLFSILVEQPWWLSVLVAALVYALGAMFSPLIGAAAALPFIGVACYVGWLRLRRGPSLDVPGLLGALKQTTPEEMRAILTEAFERQRYKVAEAASGDLELERNGYRTLVRFRRWRAQSTGPGALKELAEALRARNADHAIYVTAGAVTEGARKHAESAGMALLDGAALVKLVGRTAGARRALHRGSQEAAKA
ncbi:MAG: restriction endonuclease [Burkholderiales bacterium]|nr:restriction endonuclease [Burkholderiales bacterium]